MAILELSGVDYPYKHSIRTKLAAFEKSIKYYVCVLKKLSKISVSESALYKDPTVFWFIEPNQRTKKHFIIVVGPNKGVKKSREIRKNNE